MKGSLEVVYLSWDEHAAQERSFVALVLVVVMHLMCEVDANISCHLLCN